MIKKLKISLLALCTVLVSSCELDLLDNPNAVTTSNTDINYLLNKIQVDFPTHFNQFSDPDMRLVRMLNQGAAIYDNAVQPGGLDGNWNTAYAAILNDVKTLIPLAEKSELFVHAGVARTIRAAVLANLVDHFGDVPYSEALDATNFNPKIEGGAAIYAAAIKDLDDAAANFVAKSKGGLTSDLYYGADADKWLRAANTLKLKLLLNRRLVDATGATSGINALITGGKLISNNSQNFIFKFGTNLTNPDTRHPRYRDQYLPAGGGDYQSNAYMGIMYDKADPRMRMYFYRQTIKNTTNVNELRCITNSKPNHYSVSDYFCVPTPAGYWGRDHLSNEGIPPDGLLRTAWGLYPAGGLYDNDAGRGVSLGAGAGGAGLHPILMQSFVDFMLAESALTLKTTGSAKALLESGIRKSMADVRAAALGTSEASKVTAFETEKKIVWADEVNKYVTTVLAAYDKATTDTERLNIVANEYWFASYGNGIEAYNMYRRTGMPRNMQPALEVNPGAFVKSFLYPLAFITRNSTAKQKANVATPVFWDNGSAGTLK
ncbi:MAG: SusD/RagB family nutrient-binding outer membrane lipoprotein [Emticicia sp.]